MISSRLRKAIEKIPGKDGFWSSYARITYEGLAETLEDKGLSEEEIEQVLVAAYRAAAAEFGE